MTKAVERMELEERERRTDNMRKFRKSENCEFTFESPFFEEPNALLP